MGIASDGMGVLNEEGLHYFEDEFVRHKALDKRPVISIWQAARFWAPSTAAAPVTP